LRAEFENEQTALKYLQEKEGPNADESTLRRMAIRLRRMVQEDTYRIRVEPSQGEAHDPSTGFER
jgi:hypothetical protein